MIGSSAALSVSDIPWAAPPARWWSAAWTASWSSAPTPAQREKSTLHLTVSGTKDAVLMVEAGAREVPRSSCCAHPLWP